jgi:geranylgeranyl transferase type-2 subunit beta
MNAVYWGLTALCIMKHKEALDPEETIAYVMSCWDEDAGARRHHSIKSLSLPKVCSLTQAP